MKSKSYILMQIHDLLVNRHSYTPTRANDYIEEHKEDKVYELLVLKKKLTEDEADALAVAICHASTSRSFNISS